MELVITTITIFILTFSTIWVTGQEQYEKINARIRDRFKKELKASRATHIRDDGFQLFPFEPSPPLFKRLVSFDKLVSGSAPNISINVLASLLVSAILGFTIASLAATNLTNRYFDTLALEIALFGSVFFLTRRRDASEATTNDNDEPSSKSNGDSDSSRILNNPSRPVFSALASFFLIFAIIIPMLLWLMAPAGSPTAGSIDILPDLGRASIITDVPAGSAGRLLFGVKLIWVVALFIPIYLFLFDIADARQRLERKLFDDLAVGIAPITRIKILVSVALSVISALVVLNVNLSSLSLFSGLVAAGLSVALRESIANFFSGLQMSWDGSLKVGDVISISRGASKDTGSTYGIVRDIRNRYTVIEDRNTVRRLVPNFKMVSESIEHWTHEGKNVRLSLQIGIPYVDDPRILRQAQRIMESVCYDVPRVLATKPPNALLVGYGESQLTFSLRFWIKDAENGIRPVISEVLISLYERLCDAGIRIPYPQQEIHIKELPEAYQELLTSVASRVAKDGKGRGDGRA
jgi:small-conductance mechanosensitive channel